MRSAERTDLVFGVSVLLLSVLLLYFRFCVSALFHLDDSEEKGVRDQLAAANEK